MKQEVYKIGGMSCAACSSAVERVTRRMEGVSRSDVNLTLLHRALLLSDILPDRAGTIPTILTRPNPRGFLRVHIPPMGIYISNYICRPAICQQFFQKPCDYPRITFINHPTLYFPYGTSHNAIPFPNNNTSIASLNPSNLQVL